MEVVKISVITVCRNAEKVIQKTIDSVLAQSYPNFECLVIDGESTDRTLDILCKYGHGNKLAIFSEKDFGIYNAMNRGIARASGDYIFFLNAGDVFYDDKVLAHASEFFVNDADAIYFGNICNIAVDGSKTMVDYSKWENGFAEKILDGDMPCHQAIFAPRKAMLDHYFRERYKIRADYEWLVYSISRQIKCIHIPVMICNYDTTGISGTIKNRRQFQLETQLILREYQNYLEQERYLTTEDKTILKWKNLCDKHFYMFQTAYQWVRLKQKGRKIASYFQAKEYYSAAIYGMGYLGQLLLEELRDSGICVVYAVDRNAEKLSLEVPVLSAEEELEDVDVFIVTAITYFNEIEKHLQKKVTCKILSLEDVMNEMMNHDKE